MAVGQTRRWLIAYDVRERRRLARLHRLLAQAAVPVQYSVFITTGSPQAMRQLAAAVGEIIDAGADDVRFYQVPERAHVFTIGARMLPDHIFLLDGRHDLWPLLGRPRSSRR